MKKKLKYFYIDNNLHRILHVNRGQDLVTTWNYPERKRKQYIWSYVQKNLQKAFTITEVAAMLGKHRMTIDGYIRDEIIETPQRTYSLDGNFSPGKYMFSEDDVLKLHEYLVTVHFGRPRKDGNITTRNVPTRAEIRALVRNNAMLYTKDGDGNYIPIWREKAW